LARLLLYPGQLGPLVDLQAFLRDAHEDARAQRDREIAERKEQGAAASEHADTVAAQAAAQAAVNAGAAGNEAGMRKALDDAARALGSSALEPFPAYKAMEEIEGISVVFRVLSERDRRTLSGAVMSAVESAHGSMTDRIQAVSDARAEVVRVAVAEVHGLETMAGPFVIRADNGKLSDTDLEALKVAGLHGVLYDAAITFQVLPAKKGVRFGQPAGSALSVSFAPGVPSSSGPSLVVVAGAATLTESPATSPAHSTSQTPVPAVN
jgi:hypothetical protein